MELELAGELAQGADTKIVLFVMDGLGGLPHAETGRTELETAYIPHLDRVAKESVCGFTLPVGPGITPGSGPGHLALFGYDPLKFNIGRDRFRPPALGCRGARQLLHRRWNRADRRPAGGPNQHRGQRALGGGVARYSS